MRTYLGAVLRQPENVLVLRSVFFEGLRSGHKFGDDLDILFVPEDYMNSHSTCINYADFADKGEYATGQGVGLMRLQLQALGVMNADNKLQCDNDGDGPGFPTRLYQGTTYKSDNEVEHMNCGHMGNLDHYKHAHRLYGSFVYDSNPDPRST